MHCSASGLAFGTAGWGSGGSSFGGALCILLCVPQGLGIIRLGLGVLLCARSFAFLVPVEGSCATPGPGFVCFWAFFHSLFGGETSSSKLVELVARLDAAEVPEFTAVEVL